MTRRETTRRALRHQETGHTPFYLSLLPPARQKLVEYYGREDLYRAMGAYILEVGAKSEAMKTRRGDLWTDEFGVVFRDRTDSAGIRVNRGYLVASPLKGPSLKGYAFPDPMDPRKYDHLTGQIEAHRDLFIACWGFDFFERAHFLRGFEALMMDLLLHPRFAHDLLHRITQFNLRVIEELGGLDLDAILVSDDYGAQHGLLMSKALWEDFIAPQLAEMYQAIKAQGFMVFHHSDGDVTELIPDLLDMGLDLLHPVQPECMDIRALKAHYGDRLCFWGGISTQRTMPYGTPEEVKTETQEVARVLGKGGGHILDTGIHLQHDVPLENMLACIETAQELNRKPKKDHAVTL